MEMPPVANERPQERKSYLHRQRPGDYTTPFRPASSIQTSQSSPETPDNNDAKIMSSNSSEATRRGKARATSPASSRGRPPSVMSSADFPTRPVGQRFASSQDAFTPSASPSLERVASVDRIRDTPTTGSKSSAFAHHRDNVMSTHDSVKMQGQDTLEVRNVTLPNGQSASLVLEDGKLQRIVSSVGNIVEVHWQGGQTKQYEEKGGPDRQLAIKLRSAANMQENEPAQANKQGGLKKLANSLHSQRLSSSVLKSLYSSGAQPGTFSKSDKDIRSIRSLDFNEKRRQDASRSKRGYGVQGFQSAEPVRTASQGDMSTILEATGHRRAPEWNPMGSSWLPPNMMKEQAMSRTASSEAALQSTEAHGVSGSPNLPGPSETVTPPPTSRSGSLGKPGSGSGSKEEKSPNKALPKEKPKIWQSIKAFFKISKKSKTGSPGKDTAMNQTPRVHSFSKTEGHGQSLEEKERESRMRASSPAAPTKVDVQMKNLPAEQDVIQHPEERVAKPVFKDRAILSSSPAGQEPAMNGMMTRPLTSGGATVSSTPALPLSESVAPKQFRFGPDDNQSVPAEAERDPVPTKLTRNRSLDKKLSSSQPVDSPTARESALLSRSRADAKDFAPKLAVMPRHRTSMAGHWQRDFTQGTSGTKVDELLNVSTLQRLAREKTIEMQIIETDTTFEMKWHIPLNGSTSKISKVDRYLKNGEVVEGARRDGRAGLLRSQLTFTPEGHVHIRALQGTPYSAVFHDRLKLSSGGRRIKIEQKFQLLEPGVPPVKHFSIWQRAE